MAGWRRRVGGRLGAGVIACVALLLAGVGVQAAISGSRQPFGGDMKAFEPRVRVRVGAVSLELPEVLASRQQGAPIDSPSAVFEYGGLMVLVDQGPFAPSLNADVGRPGFREEAIEVGGWPGRLVTFDEEGEGSYTTAIEIAAPQRITVVVRADTSVPRQVPLEIVRSVQLLE